MRMRCALLAGSMLAAGLAATPGAAQQQQQPPAGEQTPVPNDEIVVTATRQGEVAISRVPLSITAESQKALDQNGIKTAQDISRIVPALRIEDAGPIASNVSIRGVRSETGSATTGVYLDDVALQARTLSGSATGGGVFLPNIFDLERVEVLKGPQGTLYGGSSEGGTVRFITPAPSLTKLSAYGRAEVNTVDQGGIGREIGAAIGAPIVEDHLGFRISGWGRRIAGFVDHVDRRNTDQRVAKDTNYQDQRAFRAALAWQPSPNLRFTPAVYYSYDRLNDQGRVYRSSPAYTVPAFGTYVGGASDGRPIFGSYTGTPIVTGVNAGQTLGGGLLPAGYVAPTTAGVVNNIPGLVGQQVFIHPAHTYGPFNLGSYETLENTNGADNYSGTVSAERSPRTSQAFIPDLTIDWTVGDLNIKSITAYLHDTTRGVLPSALISTNSATSTLGYAPVIQSSFAFDAFEPIFSNFYYHARRSAKSQEVRLSYQPKDSALTFVVGGFYNDAHTFSENDNIANRSTPRITLLAHPQAYSPVHTAAELATLNQQGVQQYLDETSIAAFGDVNYQVTAKLRATVGVRFTREEISYDQRTFGLLIASPFDVGTTVSGRTVDKPITPKVTISYQATPDDLYYLTASKGYRSGGAQGQANPVTCAADLASLGISTTPSTYGSDSVWNYEAGAKIRLFDRRLQLSGSAFYIDWKKPQTPYRLPTCAFVYTANIGHAVSKGFDLQGTLRAARGLTLDFAVGYTDSKYTKDVFTAATGTTAAQLLVGDGSPLIETPKWTANVGARYEFAVGRRWKAYGYGNYQYTDSYKNTLGPGVFSYAPDVYTTPSIDNLQVRVGLTNEMFDLSLFVDNLLANDTLRYNDLVGRQSCRNADCSLYGGQYKLVYGTTLRPRTIGLTGTFRY